MDWSNITERNMDFEASTGFSPDIDYRAELDRFNKLVQERDRAGVVELLNRHGGKINLFAKMIYQDELKKAGAL